MRLISDEPERETHSRGNRNPPRRGKQIIRGPKAAESRKHQKHDEENESLLLGYQASRSGLRFGSAAVLGTRAAFGGLKGEDSWVLRGRIPAGSIRALLHHDGRGVGGTPVVETVRHREGVRMCPKRGLVAIRIDCNLPRHCGGLC